MSETTETIRVDNPKPVPVEFTSFPVENRQPDVDGMKEAGLPEEFAVIAAEVALESLRKADLSKRQVEVNGFKQHSQDKFEKAEAEHIAETDTLTKLRNRIGLKKALDERIASGDTEFGLLFVDLDGFKQINDKNGHKTGDALLENVGKFFKKEFKLRDQDGEEAFRIGGDEFVILIRTSNEGTNKQRNPQATEQDIVKGFIDRYEKAIKNSGETTKKDMDIDSELKIGGSFGYAKYRSGEEIEDFISRADLEMYDIKTKKKAQVEIEKIGSFSGINPNNFGSNITAWINEDPEDLIYQSLSPTLQEAFQALSDTQPGIFGRLRFLSNQLKLLEKDIYGDNLNKKALATVKSIQYRDERARLSGFACKYLTRMKNSKFSIESLTI